MGNYTIRYKSRDGRNLHANFTDKRKANAFMKKRENMGEWAVLYAEERRVNPDKKKQEEWRNKK